MYIAFLVALYFAISLGWFLGYFRGNPGVIDNIGVYFVYPFVWVIFFLANGFEVTKKILIKTSLYAGVMLSILILIAAMMELTLGIDIVNFPIFTAFGIVSGTQFEGLKLGASFLPYLIFSYAMLLEIGVAKKNKLEISNIISQKMAFGAAILILTALAISGRTVMLLCIMWFFVRSASHFLVSFKGVGSLAIIVMSFVWIIDINQLNLALESKTGFTSEESEIGMRRIFQLIEGFELISNEPLLGYGVGHYFESVGDWRIEVTPVTVLVSHGLIITATLAWFYLLVLYRLIKYHNLHYVANSSFLFIVASATNPILLKFDFIWILLLPFVMFGMVKYQSSLDKK